MKISRRYVGLSAILGIIIILLQCQYVFSIFNNWGHYLHTNLNKVNKIFCRYIISIIILDKYWPVLGKLQSLQCSLHLSYFLQVPFLIVLREPVIPDTPATQNRIKRSIDMVVEVAGTPLKLKVHY